MPLNSEKMLAIQYIYSQKLFNINEARFPLKSTFFKDELPAGKQRKPIRSTGELP